jgi:hypothetical protein
MTESVESSAWDKVRIDADQPREIPYAVCPICNGSGRVVEHRAEWIKTGEEMRRDREQRGVTLQDEARARDLPTFLLTQMEQGLVRPLVRETLL